MKNFNDINEAVKYVNEERLKNKGNWIFLKFTLKGYAVQIKSYGQWIQIFKCYGIEHGDCMDASVALYKVDI